MGAARCLGLARDPIHQRLGRNQSGGPSVRETMVSARYVFPGYELLRAEQQA